MKQCRVTLGIAATVALLAGCAAPKRAVSLAPAQPVVQVIPSQGNLEPKVATVPLHADPIYFNPIIEEVEMASYINDEGNLVFPGKVLVIREPGRWNLEAAQKNRQYFVPADNQPPQLAPPSRSYYDYIQAKLNGIPTARLDVSRVRVTGYTQREERADAQSTLLPGETLSYDPYLGWLAIPAETNTQTPPPSLQPNRPSKSSAGVTPVPVGQEQTPKEDDIKNREKQLEQILDDAFKKLEKPGSEQK